MNKYFIIRQCPLGFRLGFNWGHVLGGIKGLYIGFIRVYRGLHNILNIFHLDHIQTDIFTNNTADKPSNIWSTYLIIHVHNVCFSKYMNEYGRAKPVFASGCRV